MDVTAIPENTTAVAGKRVKVVYTPVFSQEDLRAMAHAIDNLLSYSGTNYKVPITISCRASLNSLIKMWLSAKNDVQLAKGNAPLVVKLPKGVVSSITKAKRAVAKKKSKIAMQTETPTIAQDDFVSAISALTVNAQGGFDEPPF